MSSPIWTQCGERSNLQSLAVSACRLVEDQSRTSTRKLVNSDAEQRRLEDLIEGVKPPLPDTPAFQNLHYLLFTPFRYPPLSFGSRFRTRADPGVWYGALTIETALAEKAYYQLRLLEDTTARLTLEVIFTGFRVPLRSAQAVDLTATPFATYTAEISNPVSYAQSQPLGLAMRNEGATFCRYVSARDPERGHNVAVFSPFAFESKTVSDAAREGWACYATRERVEFRSQSFIHARGVSFDRPVFEINGMLPSVSA